jgi:hypothetical protein
MSDHGWKGILARVKRWLAAPVGVRFAASRDGPTFGPRSPSVEPVTVTDPPAPPRREPLRFSDPFSRPTADRQRARENEYFLLLDEIARLAHGDDEIPSPYA